MIVSLRGIISRSTYYCYGIRGITSGDWVKCFEHVLSVERVYWLKEIAAEEDHQPVVIDLASDSDCSSDTDTASCEINCI